MFGPIFYIFIQIRFCLDHLNVTGLSKYSALLVPSTTMSENEDVKITACAISDHFNSNIYYQSQTELLAPLQLILYDVIFLL